MKSANSPSVGLVIVISNCLYTFDSSHGYCIHLAQCFWLCGYYSRLSTIQGWRLKYSIYSMWMCMRLAVFTRNVASMASKQSWHEASMYHTLVVQCINYSTTIDMARTEVGVPGWERECSACYMYLRLTRRRYNIVGVRLSEVTRGGSAAVQCSTDCDIATRKLMYAAICPTQPAECSTHTS